MTNLRYCPRCGGRLRRESDLYGEYDWCLNCGYHGDVLAGPPIELKTAYKGRVPKQREPLRRKQGQRL